MSNKTGLSVGVISSAVTVVLTVLNYQLNSDIEQTKLRLQETETMLRAKAHELDVSREKTQRYEFVNRLLPGLLNDNPSQVTLTTNLIRLALSEEEAEELFSGFATSTDVKVQMVGKAGIEGITQSRARYQTALDYEHQGYEALLNGELDKAITAFEAAEKTYPTFHQVYEIAQLLRRNRKKLADGKVRKQVYDRIVREFSWKAPPVLLQKIKALAEK